MPLLNSFFGKTPEGTIETLELMEFEEGSLFDELSFLSKHKKRLKEEKILSIFQQVCSAVEFMHSQSPPITHRDLKTENVLRHKSDIYKLCDFGSATRKTFSVSTQDERMLAEKEVEKYTTMIYCAPEMLDVYSGHTITCKSDIWSLGCLLYQMAYLQNPFPEKLAIISGKYDIPTNSTFSKVNKLLSLMFVSNPEERISASQLCITLKNLIEGKSAVFKPGKQGDMEKLSQRLIFFCTVSFSDF